MNKQDSCWASFFIILGKDDQCGPKAVFIPQREWHIPEHQPTFLPKPKGPCFETRPLPACVILLSTCLKQEVCHIGSSAIDTICLLEEAKRVCITQTLTILVIL